MKSIRVLSNLLLTTTTSLSSSLTLTTTRNQLFSAAVVVRSGFLLSKTTNTCVRGMTRTSTVMLDSTKTEEGECSSSSSSSPFVAALEGLKSYHPVIIEGMGYYDPRDPQKVASNIVKGIRKHLQSNRPNNKPLLVIIQGDPLHERGISAITPIVAEQLSNGQRGLVCLDAHIADYHIPNADRNGVIAEIRYSQLVQLLDSDSYANLQQEIKQRIVELNEGRARIGKPPVKDYFETFALLQEVTKWGLKQHCDEITVAHTSGEINPFSVTSFYKVGLELKLYQNDELVPYYQEDDENAESEALDFNAVDPR